jgi:hypothetical protein
MEIQGGGIKKGLISRGGDNPTEKNVFPFPPANDTWRNKSILIYYNLLFN